MFTAKAKIVEQLKAVYLDESFFFASLFHSNVDMIIWAAMIVAVSAQLTYIH